MDRFFKILLGIITSIIIFNTVYFSIILVPIKSWEATIGAYRTKLSADGKYIVTLSNRKVSLFNKDGPNLLWDHTFTENLEDLDISADGSYIVIGGDENIFLIHKPSESPLWSFNTGFSVETICISSDGQYIFAGLKDHNVYLFHRNSSTPLWSYTIGDPGRVAISANGTYMIAGANNNTLYLFEKSNNMPVWTRVLIDTPGRVAMSADGNNIICGSSGFSPDYYIYYFERSNSVPIWNYSMGGHSKVDISFDGNIIVSAAGENLFVFSKNSNTPIWNYSAFEYISHLAISGNGENIVASVDGVDDEIIYFNSNSPEPIWRYLTLSWFYIASLDISDNGKYITSSYDEYLLFINSENPEVLRNYASEILIVLIIDGFGVLPASLIASTSHLLKRRKKRRILRSNIEDLRQLLSRSIKVKISMVKNILELKEKEFESQILELSKEFGFIIEDDYIIVEKESISEFLDALDKKFDEWENLKQKKT